MSSHFWEKRKRSNWFMNLFFVVTPTRGTNSRESICTLSLSIKTPILRGVYHFRPLSTLYAHVTSCCIVRPQEILLPKFRWPVPKYRDCMLFLQQCYIRREPCLWGRKCIQRTWTRSFDPHDQLYEHSCTCGVHLVRKRTPFAMATCNDKLFRIRVSVIRIHYLALENRIFCSSKIRVLVLSCMLLFYYSIIYLSPCSVTENQVVANRVLSLQQLFGVQDKCVYLFIAFEIIYVLDNVGI